MLLALDAVDVVGSLAEEAGALHRTRLDQRGRDHRGEAGRASLVHRQVDQGELEVGTDAGQVVEPRARHLRAALEVDGSQDPAELDVVTRARSRTRAGSPTCSQHHVVVLAARGRLLGGRVGDRVDRRHASPARPGLGGLGGLHVGGEGLGARQQARPSPRPVPSGSACRAASARRAAARSRRSPRAARCRPRGRGRRRRPERPRFSWAARSRSGSSRSSRGSITARGYRRAT